MTDLLLGCNDFKDEKNDVEHLCDEVSIDSPNNSSISLTLKFHCELAEKGIEYSWGVLKRIYRRKPISLKRSTNSFEKVATSSLNNLSIQMCRRLSTKARAYMMAYLHKPMK